MPDVRILRCNPEVSICFSNRKCGIDAMLMKLDTHWSEKWARLRWSGSVYIDPRQKLLQSEL